MVNKQIADYYNAQVGAGAEREEVRKALVGAGWPATDVDDSIKSAEPSAPAAIASASAKAPAMISVSDLIPASQLEAAPSKIGALGGRREKSAVAPAGANSYRAPGYSSKFRLPVVPIILGVIALACAGAAVYFYMQVQSAAGKITAANAASAAASANATNLTVELASAGSSTSDLQAQVSSLAAANSALTQELSFFAVSSAATSSSQISFDFTGTVGGSKTQYSLIDANGVKILVKNSKDASVDAALSPLIGQSAQVSGTHDLGSNSVTLTAVNGNSVQ
ncbi:MAG TPA: hypothetical protein VNG29_03545 [Candidatus Paceibacterota bacterium]|nr:hypothetical protein [Candidatus Paceibacterota bacterium]